MLPSLLSGCDFYRSEWPPGAHLCGHINRISNWLELDPPAVDLAALAAVNALDELVSEMVKKHQLRVPPDFLDWIADEITPELERMARRRFRKRLRSDAFRNGSLQHCASSNAALTDGHAAGEGTRTWVWQVCLLRLEQKIQGADLLRAPTLPPHSAL